jgi:hypothetical protein
VNTMRRISTRWPGGLGRFADVNRRGPITFALSCVAIFVGCFAIGHATKPQRVPAGSSGSSFPIAYTGLPIPAALSSAPPIETIAAVSASRPTSAGSAGGITATATPSSPAPTPLVQAPANEAPSPSPVSTPTPAAKVPSSHPQQHSGGGVSFDSSG